MEKSSKFPLFGQQVYWSYLHSSREQNFGLSWNFKKRTKGERTLKESFPWGDSVLLPKQKQKNNLKYPDLRDSDEVKELPSQCEDAFICSSWLEKGWCVSFSPRDDCEWRTLWRTFYLISGGCIPTLGFLLTCGSIETCGCWIQHNWALTVIGIWGHIISCVRKLTLSLSLRWNFTL